LEEARCHYVYVEDVDTTFEKAVSAGVKVLDPVVDQFWRDRHGRVEDPFGHQWNITTHIKDLSEEEMKKAAEQAFSRMSKINFHLLASESFNGSINAEL
jgi:PhnB protein